MTIEDILIKKLGSKGNLDQQAQAISILTEWIENEGTESYEMKNMTTEELKDDIGYLLEAASDIGEAKKVAAAFRPDLLWMYEEE